MGRAVRGEASGTVVDRAGLEAAVERMAEVLPAQDPWPPGVSTVEEDRWMLRAELVAAVTGMARSALEGGRPDVPALREAKELRVRFRTFGNPDEVAAIDGVLDRIDRQGAAAPPR